jgi:hypothetical protein
MSLANAALAVIDGGGHFAVVALCWEYSLVTILLHSRRAITITMTTTAANIT